MNGQSTVQQKKRSNAAVSHSVWSSCSGTLLFHSNQQFMKSFLTEIFRDKNGNFSLRECVNALLVVVMIISWTGQQFFAKPIPEFMFYSFTSLVAAGYFGYSIERKTFDKNENEQKN